MPIENNFGAGNPIVANDFQRNPKTSLARSAFLPPLAINHICGATALRDTALDTPAVQLDKHYASVYRIFDVTTERMVFQVFTAKRTQGGGWRTGGMG